MGLSLWLVGTEKQIAAISDALPRGPSATETPRSRPVAPNSYPAIIPHITLATVPNTTDTPTPADILINAVPANQRSIRAHFQSLAVGDHYFRSVFIDIEATQELVDLQRQIADNLNRRGLRPSAPRFPHMSIAYIADEDANEREETARALRATGVVAESDIGNRQSVSLHCGDVTLLGFDGVEVWMVDCDSCVETWKVEKKVKLLPAL